MRNVASAGKKVSGSGLDGKKIAFRVVASLGGSRRTPKDLVGFAPIERVLQLNIENMFFVAIP